MDIASERLSPPRKCKPANLMRYPSATVISAHKQMKENSKKSGKLNKESPKAEDGPEEVEDKTISDNKSTDTTNNNSNSGTIDSDNTKSNNNIVNTNSNNELVQEIDEATNNNNSITKSDNNNNSGSSNNTNAAPILTKTQHQDTPTPSKSTEVHPITTVDQQPQQPTGNTESTNPQDNDTNQQPTNITEPETSTVNATIEALQGKMTPEKIAIETLLNMTDSLEHDDPNLDDNALLMPVDRPPDIPIEPKGIIPTQPVNPELLPEPRSDTPPPSKGNDTDSTEILEPVKLGNNTEKEQETFEVKMTTRKKKKKVKKTVRKNKRKQNTRATQSATSEETKDVKRDPKPTKKTHHTNICAKTRIQAKAEILLRSR